MKEGATDMALRQACQDRGLVQAHAGSRVVGTRTAGKGNVRDASSVRLCWLASVQCVL